MKLCSNCHQIEIEDDYSVCRGCLVRCGIDWENKKAQLTRTIKMEKVR